MLAVLVIVLVVGWVLFVPTADWLATHDVGQVTGTLRALHLQTARDAARGRLLTFGAGVFAAAALVYTARNFQLSREGQVTERYTKAIEQLGSKELDVRLGGIYALERVARDSARDHPTVMEVLAAFVREHSRERVPLPPESAPEASAIAPERVIQTDVQAALTVIGRRNYARDRGQLDLTRADLTDANLSSANLAGAQLTFARLTRASLTDADLTGAAFAKVNLAGADLTRAQLSRAHLVIADLTGARLTEANLTGADLTGATLTSTDLTGADLTSAKVSQDAPLPVGWLRDSNSGRLKRANVKLTGLAEV